MNRQCSWRHAAATVAAAILAAAIATGPARAEPAVLTIVHVNDLDRLDGSGDRGGVARLATVVGEVRASTSHVLVTHGGDAISPSLLSSFDRGAHMIDLFNRVGFDAMVLGNHEFDFTPAVTVRAHRGGRVPRPGEQRGRARRHVRWTASPRHLLIEASAPTRSGYSA